MRLDPHYKVLGLAPGSSLAAVKRAYLREIKVWHPDRYTPDSLLRAHAEERTKALTAAYTALTTALKKDASQGRYPDHGQPRPQRQSAHRKPREGQWLGRIWRRLRDPWVNAQVRAGKRAGAEPTMAKGSARVQPDHRFRRRVAKPARRRVSPPFEQVLDRARGQSGPPVAPSPATRRLAARRARHGRRRKVPGAGTGAIDPIESRGPVRPVSPVRPIRPIGEDG